MSGLQQESGDTAALPVHETLAELFEPHEQNVPQALVVQLPMTSGAYCVRTVGSGAAAAALLLDRSGLELLGGAGAWGRAGFVAGWESRWLLLLLTAFGHRSDGGKAGLGID